MVKCLGVRNETALEARAAYPTMLRLCESEKGTPNSKEHPPGTYSNLP